MTSQSEASEYEDACEAVFYTVRHYGVDSARNGLQLNAKSKLPDGKNTLTLQNSLNPSLRSQSDSTRALKRLQ